MRSILRNARKSVMNYVPVRALRLEGRMGSMLANVFLKTNNGETVEEVTRTLICISKRVNKDLQ